MTRLTTSLENSCKQTKQRPTNTAASEFKRFRMKFLVKKKQQFLNVAKIHAKFRLKPFVQPSFFTSFPNTLPNCRRKNRELKLGMFSVLVMFASSTSSLDGSGGTHEFPTVFLDTETFWVFGRSLEFQAPKTHILLEISISNHKKVGKETPFYQYHVFNVFNGGF